MTARRVRFLFLAMTTACLCNPASAQRSSLAFVSPTAQAAISRQPFGLGFSPTGAPLTNSWVEQAALLANDEQSFSFLGSSVAVSGDTVVVGAPGYDDGMGDYVPGLAYVFVKPSGGWQNMIQTAELRTSDGGNIAGKEFGISVAIASDTIFVGTEVGEAYIYVKPPGGWSDMTETAILKDPQQGFTFFGFSLAVTSDGKTLVVGAPEENAAQGAAYVFVKPRNGWENTDQPNATLTASDAAANDLLGDSVAISGSTIVVGAPIKPYPQEYGAAYVFEKPDGGWRSVTETAKLTAAKPRLASFLGWSVAVRGDTAVAGKPGAGTQGQLPGATFVFVAPPTGWANMNETAQLTSGSTTADAMGDAIAIGNGMIVSGAPAISAKGHAGQGAIFLFKKPKAGWKTTSSFKAKLAYRYGEVHDALGSAVAFDGIDVVGGAPAFPGGHDSGEAYIFERQ